MIRCSSSGHQRDTAAERGVGGEVDVTHPAGAEPGDDRVAADPLPRCQAVLGRHSQHPLLRVMLLCHSNHDLAEAASLERAVRRLPFAREETGSERDRL
jgi:hypothetical protein